MNLQYALLWLLPLVSAFTWLGMLLAMFVTWEVEGSPHYASMDSGQKIAYISDIGAQGLKPLFIAGSCVTTVFLDLAFAAERYLRHTGRLAKNLGTAEKILSALSIVFAIAGTCGLILLSIFDTLRHPHLHDGFLLLFIAGYVISAIFICAEYQRLGVHFRQHRVLRGSFWMKLSFILIELVLAIVFAVTTFKHLKNVGAVIEWAIALIFTLYVLTFFVDLLPAWHANQQTSNMEMGRVDEANDHHKGYSDYRGQYEAQDRTAMAQPIPAASQDHITSTMTSNLSGYTNGSAGHPRVSNGTAIEHAGPGFDKVQPARNF